MVIVEQQLLLLFPFSLFPFAYSGLVPAALNTLLRVLISSRTSWSNCSGVVGFAAAPCVAILSLTSGNPSMRPTSFESALTTGRGVRAGATSPYHPSYSNPGNAASAIVGTSGSDARRSLVVTASACSRPLLTSGVAASTGDRKYWMRPDMVSVIASGVPLYGTCTTLIAAVSLNSSPA